jgi:choline dehydrogenase
MFVDHGSFDYIIVGAGSAGCLLANRLTEDPNVSVLLLEAGAKDDYIWIHIPVGYLYCIDNPRTDWRYRTNAEPGLNGRSLLYPRGKVLGGSSSINGMIYMRGQEGDYQSWVEETGDANWSWSESLKRYKKFEDYHGGANEWHSTGGAWRVEKQRLSWKILDVFRDAAVQAGVPKSDDFNRGNNHGVGYFDVNQNKGWRLNTARAFLKPAARRENLTLITGAVVDKLHFDQNRQCQSITFNGDGKVHTAHVKKEILLCAGSIGSVAILERSGIGQAARLDSLGIPVVSDLPGVGENLQDHLQLRMIYEVSNIPTLNKKANSLIGKAMIGLEYLFKRSGPMAMAPSQLGAFAMSSSEQVRPNIQYHVQPLSLDKFGEPLHTFNAFTASVCNLRPTSRGSVHIVSKDPQDAPLIAPNYLATPEDKRIAAESIRFTRKIVASEALKAYQPQEYKPGANLSTEEELIEAAGNIGTTIFHPVGTCKMGKDSDPMAVLDSTLNVRGVKGLRVVDASAMPRITSGNTAAPTMMIAYRAADLIQSTYKN